jgi:hypothetical protein
MQLKPQDVIVALKLASSPEPRPPYSLLASDLSMSPSKVFAAVQRVLHAGLLVRVGATERINRKALIEFLIHGVPYAFSADRGPLSRGIPTAHAAPPLNRQIIQDDEPPPVWPWPEGNVRGYEFSPLYKQEPAAALRDPKFYELLALVDALRGGRARERDIARKELTLRLQSAR